MFSIAAESVDVVAASAKPDYRPAGIKPIRIPASR